MDEASGGAWPPCWAAIAGGWSWLDSLLFTLPGTPVLRYGNEIGISDDLSLLERQRRGPWLWHVARQASGCICWAA
jgi:glycosidase